MKFDKNKNWGNFSTLSASTFYFSTCLSTIPHLVLPIKIQTFFLSLLQSRKALQCQLYRLRKQILLVFLVWSNTYTALDNFRVQTGLSRLPNWYASWVNSLEVFTDSLVVCCVFVKSVWRIYPCRFYTGDLLIEQNASDDARNRTKLCMIRGGWNDSYWKVQWTAAIFAWSPVSLSLRLFTNTFTLKVPCSHVPKFPGFFRLPNFK